QVGRAGQTVLAIGVHGVGTAHPFAARAAQRQAVIDIVLDPNQGVQKHLVVWLQLDLELLHVGTLILVGIVAIDFKFDDTFFAHFSILLRRSVPWVGSSRRSVASFAQACIRGGGLPRTIGSAPASSRRPARDDRPAREHRGFRYGWRLPWWWQARLPSCWPVRGPPCGPCSRP